MEDGAAALIIVWGDDEIFHQIVSNRRAKADSGVYETGR